MPNPSYSKIVSDDRDLLILVNSDDEEIGTLDKVSCHANKGVLHRAISVFLLNSKGEVLLQQRHESKALWGGYWSNACCSHPRLHETTHDAAQRRVLEELGLEVKLRFCFKFEYHAAFDGSHAEHELCSVFVGVVHEDPVINETEVKDWRWVHPQVMDSYLQEDHPKLTPWLKIEWERLQKNPELLKGIVDA